MKPPPGTHPVDGSGLRGSLCSPSLFLLSLFLLLPVLAACGPGFMAPSGSERERLARERLMEAYWAAIEDAEEARPDEVVLNLKRIDPWQSGLIWEGEAGRSRLLVATWTGWDGYDSRIGRELTLQRAVWVTLVPEVKDFCQGYGHWRRRPLQLRLEQLIGLPPDGGNTRFVELWVEPEDLFRPCPDPEITDSQCSLVSPGEGAYLAVEAEYLEWFAARRAGSYTEGGYPWTRLGYTYDWGRRRSHVGLSEFVIREGAMPRVHLVADTATYCQRPKRGSQP